MLLAALSLILIPLGLGAALCVCGTVVVGAMTNPQRDRRRLALIAVGACGFALVGLIVAGMASFSWGFIPLFRNDTGNQPATASIVFAGTLLFGCAGAWLGAAAERWLARRARSTQALKAL